jgi:hypothetical protein
MVMPILPPATYARTYGSFPQELADRFGWESLTSTVERVYAALPPAQRTQACVMTGNYGQAGALSQLAAPGLLPPVISGHNNYYLWGPGRCTGQVLIVVAQASGMLPRAYAHVTRAAIVRCSYCVPQERNMSIYVASGLSSSSFARLWPALKHFD